MLVVSRYEDWAVISWLGISTIGHENRWFESLHRWSVFPFGSPPLATPLASLKMVFTAIVHYYRKKRKTEKCNRNEISIRHTNLRRGIVATNI